MSSSAPLRLRGEYVLAGRSLGDTVLAVKAGRTLMPDLEQMLEAQSRRSWYSQFLSASSSAPLRLRGEYVLAGRSLGDTVLAVKAGRTLMPDLEQTLQAQFRRRSHSQFLSASSSAPLRLRGEYVLGS